MIALLQFLFGLLAFLLVVQLCYPFLTIMMAQLFGKERVAPVFSPEKTFDFACVITAYRNADIARPLIQSLLLQSHPKFKIYLVADECPPDFDAGFKDDDRVVVLQPNPPLRLKAKSIIHAMDNFKQAHDFVAVFDADNLAHPDFLQEINRYANAGYQCIQGQRTAKNLDTTYAALDSMGEHYKNYLERYVPYLLGGSSVISGSGMATETALYRAYLDSPEIQAGQHQWKKMLQEDKILQNFLLARDERIAYANNALVFDEKVETGAAVETQRSRWLYSYFQNLPNSLGLFFKGIFRFSFNQFYFGFVTLVLPMFIQLGIAGVLFMAGWFIAPRWSVALGFGMTVFAMTIILALRLDHAPAPIWSALWQVPKFVFRQFLGLFKMRDPNKHFKHTEHRRSVKVDDVLKK